MDNLQQDSTPGMSSQSLGNRAEHPYAINLAVDLLLPELSSIEDAEFYSQIERDWRSSPSFQRNLWRDFKEELDLTE